MNETVYSEINLSQLSNDDNTLTTIPSSTDRKGENIVPTTLNLKDKHNDVDSDSETSDVNKVAFYNNSFGNDVPKKVNNVQQTTIMKKVQSLIVPIIIICSVVVIFQIPIVLYYTNPPNDALFSTHGMHMDFRTCSVRFTCVYVTSCAHCLVLLCYVTYVHSETHMYSHACS